MATVPDVTRELDCPLCGDPIEVTFRVEAGVGLAADGSVDFTVRTHQIGSPVADHMCEKHPNQID